MPRALAHERARAARSCTRCEEPARALAGRVRNRYNARPMALELHGIAKSFGARAVLRDLSLSVEPGQIVALLGPNGAGKTTAMRIALGLVPANGGVVLVDGFDAQRDPREARARTGGLIETPGFHPHRTALDNLMELARLSGRTRDEARDESRRALERVNLGAEAMRRVEGFSQGMRQRLGIAQALLGAPRYLILDEPQNGLDPEAVASLRELLRGLAAKEGVGLLVSSHQLAELAEIATHVVVLRDGRVVHRGEMRELLAGGDARYLVRTRRPEATRELVRAQGIPFEARADGELELDLGARAPDELARQLVERDQGLLAFAPRRRTLEELYLRVLHAPEQAASGVSAPAGTPARAPSAARDAGRAGSTTAATAATTTTPPTGALRARAARSSRCWATNGAGRGTAGACSGCSRFRSPRARSRSCGASPKVAPTRERSRAARSSARRA